MSSWLQNIVLGAIVLCLSVVGLTATFYAPSGQTRVLVNGRELWLDHAQTEYAQTRGLSGRSVVGQNRGMLFSFEASGKYCFWMKDMQIPIDMIWLNDQKQVIKVLPEVSPDSYPNTFCPSQPAKYVVELKAGRAASLGIGLASQFKF